MSFTGMRARHLRDELREQMHLGPRSLQHLVAEKYPFLKHHLLRAKHELQRALVQFVWLPLPHLRLLGRNRKRPARSSDMTISDFRVSAETILTGVGPNIEVHQTGACDRSHSQRGDKGRELPGDKVRSPAHPRSVRHQHRHRHAVEHAARDAAQNALLQSRMAVSLITRRPILLSAAIDRMAP